MMSRAFALAAAFYFASSHEVLLQWSRANLAISGGPSMITVCLCSDQLTTCIALFSRSTRMMFDACEHRSLLQVKKRSIFLPFSNRISPGSSIPSASEYTPNASQLTARRRTRYSRRSSTNRENGRPTNCSGASGLSCEAFGAFSFPELSGEHEISAHRVARARTDLFIARRPAGAELFRQFRRLVSQASSATSFPTSMRYALVDVSPEPISSYRDAQLCTSHAPLMQV